MTATLETNAAAIDGPVPVATPVTGDPRAPVLVMIAPMPIALETNAHVATVGDEEVERVS
ncbi:MAG: hypothetical protein HKL86_09920 [Acidimicrobiaceae bacterium]|nr:hypothetical protein [Acidimicrobiaceae bacterium]